MWRVNPHTTVTKLQKSDYASMFAQQGTAHTQTDVREREGKCVCVCERERDERKTLKFPRFLPQ